MATVHNTLRLTTDDGTDVNINIATITYVENDLTNGFIVTGLSSATELYKLAQLYHTKTLYINDLIGLRLTFSETTIANYYADPYLKKPVSAYKITYTVFNGTKQIATYFTACAPSSGFLSKNIPITGNEPCLCFAWDVQKNELTIVAKNMEIETGLTESNNFYKYTATNYEPRVGRLRIGEFIPKFETLPHTLIAPYRQLYNVGQYMFNKYSELSDNFDANDKDKQEPGQWEYPGKNPTKPGGGDGDQDDTTTPIEIDDAPEISCDFAKLYKITKENLSALSDYMLKDDFLNNIKKLYANPIDAVICLSAMPVNQSGIASTITTSGVSTGINAVLITKNTIDIDLGTIDVKEYWGSYLDYECRLSLYLPYIGMKQISTDDFMDNVIKIKYRIDLLTGSFIVFISNNLGVVHQSTGNMAYHIPVTSIDYSRFYASLISAGVSLAGASSVGAVASVGLSTAQNMKPAVHMGGNFSGNVGFCGNKKPFLMIERPVLSVPQNYTTYNGLTSNIYAKLSDCKGFTKIKEIFLDNVTLLDSEKEMLKSILKNGIIL